jgi:hypothetical protein
MALQAHASDIGPGFFLFPANFEFHKGVQAQAPIQGIPVVLDCGAPTVPSAEFVRHVLGRTGSGLFYGLGSGLFYGLGSGLCTHEDPGFDSRMEGIVRGHDLGPMGGFHLGLHR